jgi:hypothetical protein
VIFLFGSDATNLAELTKAIQDETKNIKALLGVVAALPIGVLIHQLSVLLKNFVFSKKGSVFNDFPIKERIQKLIIEEERTVYILERISNLNSFYYVRFDNGLLSPLLAWFTVSCCMGRQINCIWLVTASIIGLVTIIYIKRIHSEIKEYNEIL